MRHDCVGPLPKRFLRWTCSDGCLLPAWLLERDRPWLRDLLADAAAFDGRPSRELTSSWRSGDVDPRAGRGLPAARHVLAALLSARAERPDLPLRVRTVAFAAAARGLDRDAALAATAAAVGMAPAAVEAALFGDLPGERLIAWPRSLHAAHLALLVNRALAQGLLLHAEVAVLTLRGAARAVLRTAWLAGAGLELDAIEGDHARLRWRASGASMPRCRRALASLVPVLPWARQWRLRARCPRLAADAVLQLDHTDPLLPGPEPQLFDSRLERRFATDCARQLPDWEVLREPLPQAVGRGLCFPDFELRERATGRRALVEIAGLRDPAALPQKLAALAALPELVLCLPRAAIPADVALHPRVVAFDRAVCVLAVRAAIRRGQR